jgi:PKD domain-containing protein/Big-like domain-containing protein/putative Ig domain-containing protein
MRRRISPLLSAAIIASTLLVAIGGAQAQSACDLAPIVKVASYQVAVGVMAFIEVTAHDRNGDAIASLTADTSGLPPGNDAVFTPNASNTGGTLTWTPQPGQTGSYNVTYTASNSLAGSAIGTLSVIDTDGAPFVQSIPTHTRGVAGPVTFTVFAGDPNGDPITSLTMSPTLPGATFTPNASNTMGTFSWFPSSIGLFQVTFTATNDLSGSTTTQIFAPGAPPILFLGAPSNVAGAVGSPMTFCVSVSANYEDMTFASLTAASLPPGAQFVVDPTREVGTFQWTPTAGQTGTFPVSFTATSGGGLVVSTTATTRISVGPPCPCAPVVFAPDSVAGREAVSISFVVTAGDPDGDPINSFTASPLPPGATFAANADHTSGTFQWTPAYGQAGLYMVTFTATNGQVTSKTTTIDVAHTNQIPRVTAPASVTVAEGATLSFEVTATDPDGDPITLIPFFLPLGATFTDHGNGTGTFNWAPDFTQAGAYRVAFRAEDPSRNGDAVNTNITVSDTNRPPVASAGGPYHGSPGVDIEFRGTASSDPDGDALTFAWDFGDGAMAAGATVLRAYSAVGTYNVVLRVTDAGGLFADDPTTATIVPETSVTLVLRKDGSTLSVGKNSPTTLGIEETEVPLANILVGTIRLTTDFPNAGTISECAADPKRSEIGDLNRNGIFDLGVDFSGFCLKNLFANTPNNSTVNLIVTGQSQTPTGTTPLRGVKAVTLKKGGNGAPVLATTYPNPFNPRGTFLFITTRPGNASVRLFDLQGRLVRVLMPSQYLAPGVHDLTVDGHDDQGRSLSSGVYFYRLDSADGATDGSFSILK